jgi:hypothetical protein
MFLLIRLSQLINLFIDVQIFENQSTVVENVDTLFEVYLTTDQMVCSFKRKDIFLNFLKFLSCLVQVLLINLKRSHNRLGVIWLNLERRWLSFSWLRTLK